MKEKEHELQVQCVSWFRYRYPYLRPLFYSVPNGGLRNKAVASKLKAEGLNPGISDLVLDLPSYNYHGLKIEMKSGTEQSEEQKIYQITVEASGYKYIVCKSLEDFIQTITEWIRNCDKNIISRLCSINCTIDNERQKRIRDRIRNRHG